MIDIPAEAKKPAPAITVIVPIYNAVQAVAVCLESLARHALPARRVLLLDDASTDPAISHLLDVYRHCAPFVCERNSRNLGFTRTVNRGMALAGEDDVVLLNSDTQVTPGWLGRLRYAAYYRSKVGSVTAVSNNAGAFSVPHSGSNAVPENFGLERFARVIAQTAERRYPEVPTGNGFCLYLRRACLDAVGLLDEQAFPRGYGEENDWCMRAQTLGWTHLIDDATYIAHVRAASFKKEKPALISAGQRVINSRYPHYADAVQQAFSAPALEQVRKHVQALIKMPAERACRVLPRFLFRAGVSELESSSFRQRLMKSQARGWECWILSGNKTASGHFDTFELWRFDEGTFTQVTYHLPHHAEDTLHVLTTWLATHAIERVCVGANDELDEALIEAAKWLGIPWKPSQHPSLATLNAQGEQQEQTTMENDTSLDRLIQDLEQMRESLDQRFEELAQLTRRLEAQRQEVADWQARAERAERAKAELEAELARYRQGGAEGEAKDEPVMSETPEETTDEAMALLETSGWFDADWYLAQYPDVAADPHYRVHPLEHYFYHGGFEGRWPCAGFDSAFYLATYSDVTEQGVNPLLHFVRFGQHEQRQPAPGI